MSGKPNLAYVVQATDDTLAVKVGYSTNPTGRFNQIRLSVPFPVRLIAILGKGRDTEKEMIDLLSPWRLRGEWFEPRPELNDLLLAHKASGNVVAKVAVDNLYAETHIKPAVLEYLAGRAPLLNQPGDLVARFLHEGLPALEGRAHELSGAVKNQIPGEVLHGWITAPAEEPAPVIKLRAESSIRAVA